MQSYLNGRLRFLFGSTGLPGWNTSHHQRHSPDGPTSLCSIVILAGWQGILQPCRMTAGLLHKSGPTSAEAAFRCHGVRCACRTRRQAFGRRGCLRKAAAPRPCQCTRWPKQFRKAGPTKAERCKPHLVWSRRFLIAFSKGSMLWTMESSLRDLGKRAVHKVHPWWVLVQDLLSKLVHKSSSSLLQDPVQDVFQWDFADFDHQFPNSHPHVGKGLVFKIRNKLTPLHSEGDLAHTHTLKLRKGCTHRKSPLV